MYSEPLAWIFLNHVRNLGPMGFHRLLELTGSAANAITLTAKDLQALGIPEAAAECWAEQFRDERLRREADAELERIQKGEFRAITELHPDYPETLRELADRPPVLYVKGKWPPLPKFLIGIVGTRRASPYGRAVAEQLTQDLVQRGMATVSGLAAGIDACAHRVTLESSGFTIAALGHGFRYRYPRENHVLFDQIASNGTLLTEFSYDSPPEAGHFPRRNRLISGLSRGVVVIEAGEHSGALITARYAAEQGRDVFAVPGSVFQAESFGCHRLIKQGAKLVETAQDILEEYGLDKEAPQQADERRFENLTEMQKQVLKAMSVIPVTIDELSLTIEEPVDRLASALLSLELEGLIRSLPGQRYVTYK